MTPIHETKNLGHMCGWVESFDESWDMYGQARSEMWRRYVLNIDWIMSLSEGVVCMSHTWSSLLRSHLMHVNKSCHTRECVMLSRCHAKWKKDTTSWNLWSPSNTHTLASTHTRTSKHTHTHTHTHIRTHAYMHVHTRTVAYRVTHH